MGQQRQSKRAHSHIVRQEIKTGIQLQTLFFRSLLEERIEEAAAEAGLDSEGSPVAWSNRIACPSIMSRFFPGSVKNGLDGSSMEGAADLAGKALLIGATQHDWLERCGIEVDVLDVWSATRKLLRLLE